MKKNPKKTFTTPTEPAASPGAQETHPMKEPKPRRPSFREAMGHPAEPAWLSWTPEHSQALARSIAIYKLAMELDKNTGHLGVAMRAIDYGDFQAAFEELRDADMFPGKAPTG